MQIGPQTSFYEGRLQAERHSQRSCECNSNTQHGNTHHTHTHSNTHTHTHTHTHSVPTHTHTCTHTHTHTQQHTTPPHTHTHTQQHTLAIALAAVTPYTATGMPTAYTHCSILCPVCVFLSRTRYIDLTLYIMRCPPSAVCVCGVYVCVITSVCC